VTQDHADFFEIRVLFDFIQGFGDVHQVSF
jgi:hypothetical protein